MAIMNVIVEKELFCDMELKRAEIHNHHDVQLFFASCKFDVRTSCEYYGDVKINNIKKFYKSLLEGFASVDGETIDSEELDRICSVAVTASNM